MLPTSLPKENFVYSSPGSLCLDAGIAKPEEGNDVEIVSMLVELNGDFSNKKMTLKLEDVNDPTRIYTSGDNIDIRKLNGRFVGYVGFEFSKFHTNQNDSFHVKLCIDDISGVEIFALSDPTPAAMTNPDAQRIPGPRVLFFGVK